MTKQFALSALALATLALNACSSEPSDWRPENKVSLDMVAPGSRSSDNFDQHTAAAADQSKGGAIEAPISSHADLQGDERPNGDQSRTANDDAAPATKNTAAPNSVKKSNPTPAEQPKATQQKAGSQQ
ncbi:MULTISPECIES: hypothetical protein [Hymenobacter]|uniref:Lipoprotein n=2 Tax=Hymenobacter TaxID=89966 RepID=A0A4Z0MES7_9BACT|nr:MULTISPECIES: hypothetical protein [Hymenobacter]TGD77867.1 hypothetical protein EU557_21470 [Hymenobacter wooponensis]TGE09432.1 hypothetical protein EU556_00945 [Hymenobacter fodinae]